MTENQGVASRLGKVSEVCATLYQVLKDFEAVVVKENDAIGRSDLSELESITDEKLLFGEKVKKQIRTLQESMDLLAVEVGEVTFDSNDNKQLSNFVTAVGNRLARVHPELESLFEEMSAWAGKLQDLRLQIFAKIETNAYLVQKLLQYHRETYAFWQAVARDSESVYGQTGKTKYGNGPQRSILNVRT